MSTDFDDARLISTDVPLYTERGWLDAANDLLRTNRQARDELERILNASQLKAFWAGFDTLVESCHRTGVLAGSLDEWQSLSRKVVLRLLATQGGPMHLENVGEILARRLKIAGLAEKLAQQLEDDADAKRLNADDLLSFALRDEDLEVVQIDPEHESQAVDHDVGADAQHREGTPYRIFVSEDGRYVQRPSFIAPAVKPHRVPTIVQLLRTLALRLKAKGSLTFADSIVRSDFDVAVGKGQQSHLEHQLAMHLRFLSSPLPGDLFAPAIEISLGLGREVSPDKLSDRFRKM